MSTDGANSEVLYQSSASIDDLDWSPNGTQVAFTSDSTGTSQVYYADLSDLSSPTVVTSDSAYNYYSPKWSASGTTLAFYGVPVSSSSPSSILTYSKVSSSTVTTINVPGLIQGLDYSPVANELIVSADTDGLYELYTVSVTGVSSPAKLITSDGSNYTYPAYSPDGNYIAFTSDSDGNDEIRVLSLSDFLSTQITHYDTGFSRQAVWSAGSLPETEPSDDSSSSGSSSGSSGESSTGDSTSKVSIDGSTTTEATTDQTTDTNSSSTDFTDPTTSGIKSLQTLSFTWPKKSCKKGKNKRSCSQATTAKKDHKLYLRGKNIASSESVYVAVGLVTRSSKKKAKQLCFNLKGKRFSKSKSCSKTHLLKSSKLIEARYIKSKSSRKRLGATHVVKLPKLKRGSRILYASAVVKDSATSASLKLKL